MKSRLLIAALGIVLAACSTPATTSLPASRGQQAPAAGAAPTTDRAYSHAGDVVVAVPHQSGSAGVASLVLSYELPDGYTVNEDAPSSISVAGGDPLITLEHPDTGNLTGTHLPAVVPIVLHEGTGTAVLDVTLIYCRSDETSLCLSDDVQYTIPLTIGPEGMSSQVFVNRSVPLPPG